MTDDNEKRHPSLERLLTVARSIDPAATKSTLAAMLGQSEQTITNWGARGVSKAGAMKAQEILHCSNYWVLTGTGPKMAKGATVERVFDRNVGLVPMGKRAFPVISAVQAGKVKEITDPYQAGDGFDIELGDDWLSDWTFALEIEGNSMLPEFRPGDRILVDPMIPARPGDFVVAKNHKEEATFKKYRVRGISIDGHEIFELVPLNEDFETVRSDEHSLIVIGVMVEHRKRYRRQKE